MAKQPKLTSLLLLAQLGENAVCADCLRVDWDDVRFADATREKKSIGLFKSKAGDENAAAIPDTVTTHVDLKSGVFLCRVCAEAHLRLPVEVADVKTIEILDRDEAALETLSARGNAVVRAELEAFLPRFVARPEPDTAAGLPELLLDWVTRKYADRDFAIEQEDRRMPEPVHELACSMLKGKQSWSKAYLVHLAFWVMVFENATVH